MAVGWITVLKLVPWGEVIKNAPVVADAARKLWDTVGSKPPLPPQPDAPPAAMLDAPDALLRQRLAEMETAVAALQTQMQASSSLIKALAEQNAELIRRVEAHRVRVGWLSVLAGALLAVSAVGLGLNLSS